MNDRVTEIARRALQRGGGDREGFLDGACGDDAQLRAAVDQEIARLKAADKEPTRHVVDAPGEGPDAAAPSFPATWPSEPPKRGVDPEGALIGHFKVLQLIGEGGFGYVYMAQQLEPVKRKVALKVIKPGMDSKQIIGRFETERQALAMMDHPNIARVFDAGTTPTGRPYFVMELVRGVPITEYCDTQRLSTDDRLALFVTVCQAVLHAHMKGIVHRDLKPSNVLVTLHDGTAVVKVIDFGIAKAMNQELSGRTVFTEFRQFIGTPEYMAPEQASMSGLDVDTRADIYSLGVMLYELISGEVPFDPEKLRSGSLQEIQKIICESEPPKPSTRLARTAKGGQTPAPATRAEEVARQRRTDARSLRRRLSGDLDCIVLKAMEKDRTRRYETAGQMGYDIQRHLLNEPIMARPASTVYRLRKFARRNRVGIGAAGLVVYALLLAFVALGYGLIEVSNERDKTAERETEARAQLMLSNMNAVREYTAKQVRPALQTADSPDAFRLEMVPGYSARRVFENLKKDDQFKQVLYKEAAPNPTNRNNRADAFEAALVENFVSNRDLKEQKGIRELNGVRTFYISRPMVIGDRKCLDCHTTPETAPRQQVEIYGTDGGYHWNMNEVIAAQTVYVPVSEAFLHDHSSTIPIVIALAGLSMLGVLGSLWWLLRRV